jgi:peptide chain release factor 2
MYELEQEQITGIKQRLDHLVKSLDLAEKEARLNELETLTADPGLWSDGDRARALLQEQQALKSLMDDTRSLQQRVDDVLAFVSLAAEERDESCSEEIQADVSELEKAYGDYEFQQTLSGELDRNNAYLSIHAGAGGTEACDWVSMLLRMYTRWCDSHGMRVKVIDSLDGEEAGYKSATLYITGEFAFGYLKAEQGVHRLVRISPFDSNKRRHTSFASVDVTAEVDENIEIEIDEKDLRIDTYRSSGAGGQHVNVTDSAVRITHLPTGIVVACQNERSQHKNRATALKMLKARLYQLELEERQKKASADYASKQKIEWGSQIRSYVLHPYNLVKDLRTQVETSNTTAVLDGEIDEFIETYLRHAATLD